MLNALQILHTQSEAQKATTYTRWVGASMTSSDMRGESGNREAALSTAFMGLVIGEGLWDGRDWEEAKTGRALLLKVRSCAFSVLGVVGKADRSRGVSLIVPCGKSAVVAVVWQGSKM